jgi:hypothetical protein
MSPGSKADEGHYPGGGSGTRLRSMTLVMSIYHNPMICYTGTPEQFFGKLKNLLRKAIERAVEATWKRIGALLDEFKPGEFSNYFKNSGYGST